MEATIPWPSVLNTRLFCVLAYYTTTTMVFLLCLSENGGISNAFRSSTNPSHRRLPDSSLSLSSLSSEEQLSELELLQRSLYRKEFDNLRQESTWLDSMKQMPFECTGCGNCCKTTGNVYMSPQEVSSAASYKNTTTSEFIDSYAGYRLETTGTSKSVSAGDGEVPWILLQNRDTNHGEGPAACIFLDRETNQCGIYSVRPIQCSTYPFWSNILESKQNWNDEVRRVGVDVDVDMHGADSNEPNNPQDLPSWTPEEGGCEGMKTIGDPTHNESESEGVPTKEALEQLSMYKRADRRLPRNFNK
eukprot:CAMPEP_0168284456 /NCGR_PEP_ID=MMETSP0141_2-20121125/23514_1 /TAXON_ID=44445 /ORGANISM="Pseudo-nitzschia australis, Strain 10249 10 AB" /LENGTH=302 /DNA_ID=CAMNT_0008228457 /DNA_START=148 /DNA_END=1053 /DNA_ORIENTATION=+